MLTDLRKCGLNIVRMNFSHGSYEYHGEVVTAARTSVTDAPLDKRLVAIALDTKGPEIRTGLLKGGPTATIELVAGGTITVTTDPAFAESCDEQNLYMDYANLPKVVAEGGIIFVDDGLLALKVKSIDSATSLTCDVVNTASLGSKKGCNLPEVDVDLPALSEKDKKDLAWGVGQDVDMIFASFIRKASDVREVRKCLTDADPVVGKRIRIISKIEILEPRGDAQLRRDPGGDGRRDGGARRPWDRDSDAEGVPRAEDDDRQVQHGGQAGDLCDPDARVDDEQPAADACGGERCGERGARRRRLRDAIGRDGQGQVPEGGGLYDGECLPRGRGRALPQGARC